MENTLSIDAPTRRDRNLVAWIRLACLLLLATLAVPFFTGKVYVADDLGAYHLPLRAFYSDQLSRGEPFDWLPTLFNGFYLTGEGQVGTYHPLHLLLYRWLPLGAAFDLEALASYPFMALGMALFLRRRLNSQAAAWFGALVFTFSGFNLLHFVHPNAVAVVAHIPWILWAADVALGPSSERQARLARLALGLLTASQLLLGYPQYVWLSLIAEAAYIGWRIRSHDIAYSLGRLLFSQGYGIVAGAIQWLPTLEALSGSVRHSADTGFVNSGSLHPLNIVQLVAPYLFRTRVVGQNTHELGLYLGAVPCLLCCWLFLNRRLLGTLRPLASAALALGIVALVLACGQYGYLYSLQQYLPLVGRFRFPCRAIVLLHLAMALGAALGFLLLIRTGDGQSPATPVRTACLWWVVAASIALAIVGPWLWSAYVAAPAYVWIGPALFVAAALGITLAARGRRGALVAIVLLAAVDQGVYGASYAIFAPTRTADLHHFVAATPVPAKHEGLAADEKVSLDGDSCSDGPRQGNRILLTGAARIDGYAGLEPEKQLDYRQVDNLRLAGARWMQNCTAQPDNAAAVQWTAIDRPFPRARLVNPNPPEAARGLPSAAASPPTVSSLATAAELAIDRPGRIEVITQAPTRQLLVLTESYHAGWQATLDGQPCPVLRVDGDFLGCAVDAGLHRVDWQFHPRSLRDGALLSAGGLGLLLCSFACGRRKPPIRKNDITARSRRDDKPSPGVAPPGESP